MSVELPGWFLDVMAYPEGKVLQTLRQAGQRLVARTGLCDESESRGRAGKVSACKLDALGIARLVLEGA